MRRAPARPVGACFVRTCCAVVVQEHDLRATPAQCNAKRTLSSHFTVHASHPALHTSHLHFTLHTSSHLKSCELFSPHLSFSYLFNFAITRRKDAISWFYLLLKEFKKLLGHMGLGYQQLVSFFNKDNVPWRNTKLVYVVARWWTAQKCNSQLRERSMKTDTDTLYPNTEWTRNQ